MKSPTEIRAFCNSVKCTGRPGHLIYKKDHVMKDVPKSVSCCPDCGSALEWRKPGSNIRVKDVTTNRNKNYL